MAERLKEKTYHHEEYKTMVLEDADDEIDNLLKEMVGDTGGKRKEEIP
jgi:hypothetical protein